ncbi:MAG: hypothetical protein GXX96_39335 [Planctomycetaceae bacterium]|nr:hypothetical protein [Planctomycetaceae bacterium]
MPGYELVIARGAWEQVLPTLVTRPGTAAVGQLRLNRYDERTELLVRDLEVTNELPEGTQYPALADWVVIVCPSSMNPHSPEDWVARLRPRAAQLLVVALIGIGDDHTGWDGMVVQGENRVPLGTIRVIGPGMVRADREPPSAVDGDMTSTALLRWSRSRGALGDAVWQKVRTAKVALFGASRSGSILALQLAALGVSRVLLCDPDTLEVHNLDSMLGVTEEDVGKKKVEALAKRLVRFRSDMLVQGLDCSAADARVVDRVRAADLLVTCTDSDTPRLTVAMLADRYLKVHLDIGTGVTINEAGERQIAADVRLLVPRQGCVKCVGGLPDEEEARYELLAPPGALRRTAAREWSEERAGSLVTINTMSVAVGVQLWLDLLGGELRTSHWTRLRWHAGRGLEIHEGPVGGSKNCRVCGARGAPAGQS